MNTKALRQKILDLAIHGKLVPQDPNDEPASVLLERIRAEKERLIKEGKIKRPKKSKTTSDKPHYPYELPEGWVWCKLEDIATFGGGKTPSMDIKEYWNKGKNLWVTSKDMKNDSIHDSLMKITDEALNIMTQYEKDTLLVVTRSGILRHSLPIAILEKNATINQDIKSIMPLNGIIPKFLFYAIKANENIILTEYHKDGTTVDSIDFDKFKCLPIPLPPINEQKRIITEVLKVSASIDCIDCGKADLYTAIAQAKNKILDLAIHGKLVPQDPTDEPASELLKRINPKAEITSDNGHYQKLPFKIPKSWVWCGHNNVLEISGGSQPAKNLFISVPKANYIRLYQIRDYGENPIPVYIPEELASKRTEKGDILLARYGGSLGKVFHAERGAYNVAMAKVIFKFPNVIFKDFAYYYYLSDLYQGRLKEISRTAQAGFNSSDFNEMLFPLPPYEEQKRIVNVINKTFTILDKIAVNL